MKRMHREIPMAVRRSKMDQVVSPCVTACVAFNMSSLVGGQGIIL